MSRRRGFVVPRVQPLGQAPGIAEAPPVGAELQEEGTPGRGPGKSRQRPSWRVLRARKILGCDTGGAYACALGDSDFGGILAFGRTRRCVLTNATMKRNQRLAVGPLEVFDLAACDCRDPRLGFMERMPDRRLRHAGTLEICDEGGPVHGRIIRMLFPFVNSILLGIPITILI